MDAQRTELSGLAKTTIDKCTKIREKFEEMVAKGRAEGEKQYQVQKVGADHLRTFILMFLACPTPYSTKVLYTFPD